MGWWLLEVAIVAAAFYIVGAITLYAVHALGEAIERSKSVWAYHLGSAAVGAALFAFVAYFRK